MLNLVFKNDKKATRRLGRAQKAIDKFTGKHKGELSKRGHKKLRRLLSRRADALSKATGMKIHTLFD